MLSVWTWIQLCLICSGQVRLQCLWYTGDALCLPFEDGSIDSIIAIQCFGYFDPPTFLWECNRVLADRGLLIMQAVNADNYKRVLKRMFTGYSRAPEANDNLSCRNILQI